MPAEQTFLQSENLITQIFREKLGLFAQIHAGAIANPDGKGILIIGPSGSGKTSITLASILAGWSWLSDEYALIPEDNPMEVKGFPRNFNLKERSWKRFPDSGAGKSCIELHSGFHKTMVRLFNPLEIRPESHISKAELAAIILPIFSTEPTAPIQRRLEGIEALGKLLPEIQHAPAWLMDRINIWIHSLPIIEITYHDVGDLPPLLGSLQL
ncbi:hypothetical protein N9B94_04190 [Verrucomicrobia bacterium]|nr:hypothetical protein [Verrucomicrobiota bacterium]